MGLAVQAVIGFHIGAALSALILGIVVLSSPKGTKRHKLLGRIWVVVMSVVAVGSFSIRGLGEDGGMSWIHGLSIFTLIAMVYSIYMIRRGNRRAHFSAMIGCLIGVIVAGLFTLDTDRIIGGFFFGG